MTFRWRADNGPFRSSVTSQGIRTSMAKEPYIFVIFQGAGILVPCPPLWIRACMKVLMMFVSYAVCFTE